MNGYREEGVVFASGSARLVGVAAIPDMPGPVSVLFLVGGPQYRAGSHRQFTLMARRLAENGVASLRFDYPGMGDSEGERVPFEACESDVAAAVSALLARVPQADRVVLWGLCDAASTAMMFGHALPAVAGMILANPWVHGGEYSPGFRLSHYYRPLLTDANYWKRLISGQLNVAPAFADAAGAVTALWRRGSVAADSGEQDFVERMLHGVECFQHPALLLLSDNDLTAKEFLMLAQGNKRWRAVLDRPSTRMHAIAGANHTFSRANWREEVLAVTLEWLKDCFNERR